MNLKEVKLIPYNSLTKQTVQFKDKTMQGAKVPANTKILTSSALTKLFNDGCLTMECVKHVDSSRKLSKWGRFYELLQCFDKFHWAYLVPCI